MFESIVCARIKASRDSQIYSSKNNEQSTEKKFNFD